MKRILLISAASVAFASVAAAQDAAVALTPEVSGSATAGTGTGATYVVEGKTLSIADNDMNTGEYFDFDIDVVYTWGDFTATFNLDGDKTHTSDFYTNIEFQLTYSDGGWEYTVGSHAGDTLIEADGSTGTFGYSDDIPSVFDTTFQSEVETDGFLGSGVFPADATSSNFLTGGNANTDSGSSLASDLGVGGSAVLAPDYAILVAGSNSGLQTVTGDNTLTFPDGKQVDYDVSTATSTGLYFIDPTDTFGVVASTTSEVDSKTGGDSDPTLTLGGFFETDFAEFVARITPTETAINASAEYEISGFTLDFQVASHSYENGLSGDDAVAFERTGSSVGVTFDAVNATHTITIEQHGAFDVDVAGQSRDFEQGGSSFVSYDGEFGDFAVHLNQGTRDETNVTPDGTSDSNYMEGTQTGLVVEYNLTDDVSLGLGYASMTAETDAPGTGTAATDPATAERTFLDAGIKISF